ncbi:MAG: Do family serine endopeptidase [Blastomonas sp.]
MRYVYGVTSALLIGGSALALATGHPAGAQVAQNEESAMRAAMPPAGAPATFADLTEQLQPAVVNISTRQRVRVSNNPFAGTPFGSLFGDRGGSTTREAQSLGSGFIVTADGYVVTNNHVVAAEGNAVVESITVTMPDGTEYEAELVGRDEPSDLAVLKIEGSKPFPFVKFGDSTKTRVGDWVIAIGNPFGLGGTVTSGIISAVYRNTGSGSAYDRYLQTDASINRGNSGGPMFDLNGNVIGINNAIISPTGGSVGIGFAIPAEVAAPIVEQLKQGKTPERGFLGVGIRPLEEDLALSLGLPKNRGEFIEQVLPDGAAAKAGIKAGDVIVKIGGKEVTPDQTLSFIVANTEPGTTVPIELIRDGKRMTLSVKVGKNEESAGSTGNFSQQPQDDFSDQDQQSSEQATRDSLGIAVVELTPQIARQVGVSSSLEGVVISAVDPSSDAARKGLRRGFVITEVSRSPVKSPDDLDRLIAEARASGREAVLLRVKQGSRDPVFVPVRLREDD